MLKAIAVLVLLAGCGPDHSVDWAGTYRGNLARSGTCGTGPFPFEWKISRQADLLLIDTCEGLAADYSGKVATLRAKQCLKPSQFNQTYSYKSGTLELSGSALTVMLSTIVDAYQGTPSCTQNYAGTLTRL